MLGGGEPLFREHGRQVAALCWRADPALEILLVTSLTTKRWILPKGWPMDGLTAAQSAQREALEEAGVTGEIAADTLGSYHYLKEKKDGGGVPCYVEVFALRVTGQQAEWDEKGARDVQWLVPDQAIARIVEPGLRLILEGFCKSPDSRRRAV
jgi:8-oxo-dGTP pyrophosphatase MutT (NUDIX family)